MQRFDAQNAFYVRQPDRLISGVVFASPHSGADYGPDFLDQSILDPHMIRSSEDAYVDQLFESAVEYGATVLAAKTPRAYVDFNRAAEELDPALIEGIKKTGHNPRIASGLGVIPRVVAGGRAIYRGKLSITHAHQRLDHHWRPYHAQLQNLLTHCHRQFGKTVLIDCHSMPHEAINPADQVPQIVLGDRFGASSGKDVVDQVEAAFQKAGFRVARNAPFAGAYITQHYGRPSRGQHVVQIEIDRSLYMDEISIAPLPSFELFKRRLQAVISDITHLVQGDPRQLAAE